MLVGCKSHFQKLRLLVKISVLVPFFSQEVAWASVNTAVGGRAKVHLFFKVVGRLKVFLP